MYSKKCLYTMLHVCWMGIMCAVVPDSAITNTSGSIYRCNRCGHVWVTRKTNGLPHSCPKCRSVIWNKECKLIRCMRCGHEWVSTKAKPTRCPSCHTSRWDTPEDPKDYHAQPRVQSSPAVVNRVRELHVRGLNNVEIARELGISFQAVHAIVSAGKEA